MKIYWVKLLIGNVKISNVKVLVVEEMNWIQSIRMELL